MRCPSCGTENAPDSRFCGGCGARFGASAQRLAPTQKISDDASFPQRPASAGGGHGGHVVAQPGAGPRLAPPPAPYAPSGPAPQHGVPRPRAISSAPPAVYAPSQAVAKAPNGSVKQPTLRPRTSQLDDPSLSMPIVARRPWGLIIVVLLLDLGLGIAGAWMLSEGLRDKPSAKPAAPRSSASATPANAIAAGAEGAPIEPRTAAAAIGSATPATEKKSAGAASAPVDPYATSAPRRDPSPPGSP